MQSDVPTYGRCFASLALGLSPVFLLLAVSTMFGANTVTSGDQYVHGFGALVVCAVLNLVIPAIFAGLQKLGYIFLGLLSRLKSKPEAHSI